MKKRLFLILAAFAFAMPLSVQPVHAAEVVSATKTYPQGLFFPYYLLNAALAGNIDEYGNIDYLKVKDDKNLAEFINALASANLKAFPTFDVEQTDPKTGKVTGTITDRSAELVFWINAYNGSVIHAITQHYPVKSVDKIEGFDTAKVHEIAGEKYSLADLRQKIGQFDPRALFALMTGSRGGILPAKDAYRYSYINSSLDAAVRNFVNNPSNVKVVRIQNEVRVNEYFKLFDEAFRKAVKDKKYRRQWGGVRYLLAAYTERSADQRYLTNSEYQLEFAPVSHELNDIIRK